MASPFSAVLLAAGRSTRMGRDKALLEIGGQLLWQRQREILTRTGAAEIFLSARPEQSWIRAAKGFTAILHDASPDCGPISGITAALERATHSLVAVLAIDLPRASAEWFETMLAESSRDVGVVGMRGDFFEPLASIYPRAMMPLAWEALAGGKYSLQPLLRAAVDKGVMRSHPLSENEVAYFENWNAAADS